MKFDLDPAYLALQAQARELAHTVEPMAQEADDMSVVHPGVLAALRRSGLTALMVPAAYGGRSSVPDPLAICLVREILMGTSSHLDSLFALQGIGSYAITVAGSEKQRSLWLPRVATADALAALALTEEQVGSDLKQVAATLVESNGGLRLNGTKSFISNGGAAAFYVVFAKELNGYSMVLVPADLPGVSVTPTPEIIAPHVLGEIHFKDVQLPMEARLGEPARGLDLVLATLAVFRVSVAGAALGLGRAALEEAVRHTRQREQFGRPLAKLGPVAQMLADCWTDLEMARWLTYRAAALAVKDPAAALNNSSMAKLAATEAASRIVDRCVQMMGRFGLIRNSKIERLYRQARPMRIYEGASEVLRLGIARKLVEEVQ